MFIFQRYQRICKKVELDIIVIKSKIKKQFKCNKNKLWNIITDNNNYSWRTDLSKIEIIDETHFIEYAKNNYPTYFTITSKEEIKEYRFDIENTNIKGKWTGLFKDISKDTIELDFTEEVEVNNFIMKLLAKTYFKVNQNRYMKDLEKELNKR